ncbi:MAG: hypothetical protein Q7U91_12685 [Sideroxyarcus sp.]|nr:hypothetical protein [Sideroxyarcus sp.]
MLETISPVLSLITTAAKAMHWFADLRKQTKGEVRALIEELKENSRLCFRAVEDGIAPEEIIPKFSTAVFDRLNESGFDFNAVKRKDIPLYEGMENTDLASWADKSTHALIESIYDKIKDIRSLHATSAKAKRRFGPRIINIHKRLLLLLRHARS